MGIDTETYIRKPLYVEAVRITEENFDEIAAWVPGKVQKQGSKRYIKVMVANPKSDRQTKAYVGDWILWTERGGHKVYTPKAFELAFDKYQPEQVVMPQATIGLTEKEAREHMGLPEKPIEEFVEATPENIAQAAQETDAAREQEEAAQTHEYGPGETKANTSDTDEFPAVEPDANERIPEEAGGRARMDVGGKRVLSEEEQQKLGVDEVRELLRTGDVVLEQDVAA